MQLHERKLLINATGTDKIKLWYFNGERLEFEIHENRTWIFVTGSAYDLDFLENQLDSVEYVETSRDALHDIFGRKRGLRISLFPSKIKDMVFAISNIGSGRKFQIYNSDVNPVLKFISLHDLKFFELDEPTGIEPSIPRITIRPICRNGDLTGIFMDDDFYDHIDRNVLSDVNERIRESIIIVYDNEFNSFFLLLDLMERYGLPVQRYRKVNGGSYESYGRVQYKSASLRMNGKICIPSDSFIYSEAGLNGIFQISRISSLPPETAAIVTPGTAVSSLEESYAIRNGIMIPQYKNDHETEKTMDELFQMDRGGIVLQPEPGIYENAFEIDFSSMYPSIIVRYNLSPETISRQNGYIVPDSPYFVDTDKRGFLSRALEYLLETRLFYKSIKQKNKVYENRDTALKWLLLTSFGYTGYKNAKFGRIEVHEAITSIGRWALSEAMRIANEHGFSVIHGIVDSLWLSGNGDIESLLHEIWRKTRIDIVLDGHYKWITFFPAANGLGAVNRYAGLRHDSTYKFRGIELRRSDVPVICKKFQIEALEILKSCNNISEIMDKKEEIELLKMRYVRDLWKSDPEDLLINVIASKRPEDYTVNGIQKVTLETFARNGIEIQPGQSTNVIVTSWRNHVLSIDHQERNFDRLYYEKLLFRSFRIFDFIFSNAGKKVTASLYDPEYSQSYPQGP